MAKILLTLLFIAANGAHLAGQTPNVREIKITSSWGGLGVPRQDRLHIVRRKNQLYSKDDRIEKRLVENLIAAFNEPTVEKPELANLGITQNWLDTNAVPAARESDSILISTPSQEALLFSSYRNLKFIEKILPSIFRGSWSDDYPLLNVEVLLEDGRKIVAKSDAQPLFMLPIEVERNGQITPTYNAHISRAIAALLPKNFVNKDRLRGDGFRRELVEAVRREIEDEWEYLYVENQAGDALSTLKGTYLIKSATINSYHGVDHGKEWLKGDHGEKNAYFVLSNDGMPERYSIRLILPFKNKKVENLDVFKDRIGRYNELVRSVSWLRDLIDSNQHSIWLRFVKDRSFSEKAMGVFAEDMRILGKPDLAFDVAKYQNDIALISVGAGIDYWQSYWLVMPDRRVILWRYGYRPGLKWLDKDFASQTCTTYHSGKVQCVGMVIGADGQVVSALSR